jgi:mono/diheme cytochrome c family protein
MIKPESITTKTIPSFFKSITNGGALSFAHRGPRRRDFVVGVTGRRVGGINAALLLFALAISIPALVLAEADGKWLHRVPDEDRGRINPVAGRPEAIAAGKNIFSENCAKCHGADANGRRNRPSLRSERIRAAKDGELAWMLKNGNPYKGMPPWSSLPEQQRWQIIAYLRTLPISTHPAKP